MTACFTGHRPNKLNGYNPQDNKQLLWKLRGIVVSNIEEGVDTFISGMALGVDMWAARIVLKLKEKYPHIKLIAAVPCADHPNKWQKQNQQEWQDIIDKADQVVYVSSEPYTAQCMMDRNIYMVDNSDRVIAVWDGTKGGTGNCIAYAKKSNKSISILNPNEKG